MITTRYLPGGSGTIFATGPGSAVREQPIPKAGRYELFFNGSFGRPVDVYVDGHHVATAAYQESYPDQWDLEGTVYLSRGVHRIEFRRGGISAHPGNGNGLDAFSRTIGPLVIYPRGTSIPAVRDCSARRAPAAVPLLATPALAGDRPPCVERTGRARSGASGSLPASDAAWPRTAAQDREAAPSCRWSSCVGTPRRCSGAVWSTCSPRTMPTTR